MAKSKKSKEEINDLDFLASLVDDLEVEDQEEQEETKVVERVIEKVPEDYEQLKNVVSDIKEYLPIIEKIKTDPTLQQQVVNYIEQGGETPKSIREKLGLPEDFVIDMDEVVNNPESDSAKAFNLMVDSVVSNKINEAIRREQEKLALQERQKQIEAEKEALKKKYNLTDKDIEDLEKWASQKEVTYEMMFKLKNLEERNFNVLANEMKEKERQREYVKGFVPPTKGGKSREIDEDELLFEKIEQAMNPFSKFAKAKGE